MASALQSASPSLLEVYKSEIPRVAPEGSLISKIKKYISQKSGFWGNPYDKVEYRKLAELFMPSYHASQSKEIKESFLSLLRSEMKEKFLQGREVKLITADHENIHAFHFDGAAKKAILFLHGNGGFFETCFEQALQLKRIIAEDVHVMMFNPRGTGESAGVPLGLNLSLDVVAAFQYLVNAYGIDPSQITIYGHSMGGCIGSLGARVLQEIYPHSAIQMIVDRSFASLLDFQKDSVELYETKAHCQMTKRAIELWTMDTVDSLLALKGRVGVVSHADDEVIHKSHSLISALSERDAFSSSRLMRVDIEELADSTTKPHSRFFREDEFEKISKLFQSIAFSL